MRWPSGVSIIRRKQDPALSLGGLHRRILSTLMASGSGSKGSKRLIHSKKASNICGLQRTCKFLQSLTDGVVCVFTDIPTVTISVTVGQTLNHICNYERGKLTKILCKGEDPSRCKDSITSTASRVNKTVGRFSMKEEKCNINATVTIREVTLNDSGTYWCGAKGVDNNKFFQRLILIVGE